MGVEVLIKTGNKQDGVALAVNTLQLAVEYGLVDIALSLARRLAHYYSNIEPNSRKRKFYQVYEKKSNHLKQIAVSKPLKKHRKKLHNDTLSQTSKRSSVRNLIKN